MPDSITIAAISDTHMQQPDAALARAWERHLAAADVLVHCGDHVGQAVHHFLAAHPRLVAVRGNCDWEGELAGLPQFAQCSVEGPCGRVLLGACHGWGPRSGVPGRVAEHFGPGYDLCLFGHTHARLFETINGVLLLNPGSFAEGSMAVATLGPGGWDCRFLDV